MIPVHADNIFKTCEVEIQGNPWGQVSIDSPTRCVSHKAPLSVGLSQWGGIIYTKLVSYQCLKDEGYGSSKKYCLKQFKKFTVANWQNFMLYWQLMCWLILSDHRSWLTGFLQGSSKFHTLKSSIHPCQAFLAMMIIVGEDVRILTMAQMALNSGPLLHVVFLSVPIRNTTSPGSEPIALRLALLESLSLLILVPEHTLLLISSSSLFNVLMRCFELRKGLSLKGEIFQYLRSLLHLCNAQGLSQQPFEIFIKGVNDGSRALIKCMRVCFWVKGMKMSKYIVCVQAGQIAVGKGNECKKPGHELISDQAEEKERAILLLGIDMNKKARITQMGTYGFPQLGDYFQPPHLCTFPNFLIANTTKQFPTVNLVSVKAQNRLIRRLCDPAIIPWRFQIPAYRFIQKLSITTPPLTPFNQSELFSEELLPTRGVLQAPLEYSFHLLAISVPSVLVSFWIKNTPNPVQTQIKKTPPKSIKIFFHIFT
ncbi:hypothetical protein VP01_1256g2 [Puccinia sorghi]|uniref:Uncharacterized protein n=1 Tax=Puccinia sorghi TaxID=27349 RepID=A0A0L6VPA7_9BASI|nr:hypothetical protein VP01_1256g2 [Puccinia sorghi]